MQLGAILISTIIAVVGCVGEMRQPAQLLISTAGRACTPIQVVQAAKGYLWVSISRTEHERTGCSSSDLWYAYGMGKLKLHPLVILQLLPVARFIL